MPKIDIMNSRKNTYASAILEAFEYLLENYEETFILGQGLWSPWYVGKSMTNLEKKFGKDRVFDTPISESAVTSAAVGASLANMKPIVVHPRMDFMLYSMDAIINHAAKWSHMFGGQARAGLTIRAIINRGGEQGAQHSQALHSLFTHIPGLRVVMPSTPSDARDLLISSVLSKDPVIYIDDRWLYETEETIKPINEIDLVEQEPKVQVEGEDLTIIASGYSTHLAMLAAKKLNIKKIFPEIVDIRVLSPLKIDALISSVKKTRRLVVIDQGNISSGYSSEILAKVFENIDPNSLISAPKRIALPDAPAPTSKILEKEYYITEEKIIKIVEESMDN